MSFVKSLQFYLKYLRLWGIYPVRILTNRIQASSAFKALPVCYCLLVFGGFVKHEMDANVRSYVYYVTNSPNYFGLLGSLSAFVASAVKAGKIQNVFETFQKLDLVLSKYGCEIGYPKLKVYSSIWVLVYTFMILLPSLMEFSQPLWLTKGMYRFVFGQLLSLINGLVCCNFGFLGLCIYRRFQAINEKLKVLATPSVLLVESTAVKCKPSCKNKHVHQQKVSGTVSAVLGDLQKVHLLLGKIGTSLVSIYGFSIISIVVHQFCGLLGNYFFACSLLLDGGHGPFKNILLNLLKWSMLAFLLFFTISLPYGWAAQEGADTLKYLREFYMELPEETIKEQVDNFAIQLSHPLHFCPFGLFNLDATFLLKVLGGLTTYLMIILQLRPIGSSVDITQQI